MDELIYFIIVNCRYEYNMSIQAYGIRYIFITIEFWVLIFFNYLYLYTEYFFDFNNIININECR